MARSVKCPHCGQVMKVAEESAGKRVDCPLCRKAFLAPKALATPAMPTAAPPTPAAPSRIWYVYIDGRNDGPHTPETVLEHVKTGKIDAHTLAWKKEMRDWQPLGELDEFSGAFAAPPPVTKHVGHRPHERAAGEHEPRAHFSRGKGKADVMVGFWVAGGLAFAALLALLIIMSRKDNPSAPRPQKSGGPSAVTPVAQPPTTGTKPGMRVIVGPVDADEPPKPGPKAEASNTTLLVAALADVDARFKRAIVAHTKGQPRPIGDLSRALKRHAEELAGRDWRPYKDEMEVLIKRLNDAGDGIGVTIKERTVAWEAGTGASDKQRSETLELDKFDWITNWQKAINEDIARLKKKGMEF